MIKNKVLQSIRAKVDKGERCHWLLLDPDDFSPREGVRLLVRAQANGIDALLVGGSLMQSDAFLAFVAAVKKAATVPVILFPGDATQLSPAADAVLYLSLVSGRNPVMLIGEHVKGAPLIKKFGLEPIATAYMLVESGAVSSVEFMSNTRPLPRSKPKIAAAHALASQYMGMQMIYLEAGSGAPQTVPLEMISLVRKTVGIPLIVGGGIRTPETAAEILAAGADIIVTGNLVREKNGVQTLAAITRAVKAYHPRAPSKKRGERRAE
jgi:phosphoglycerol geranylgeranyltransferase